VAAFVLVVMGLLWAGGRAAGGSEPTHEVIYRVRAGDTLWTIASGRLGSEADPRSLVEDIRDLNALRTSALVPGQILHLPAA
jgi:LysM repeat protein